MTSDETKKIYMILSAVYPKLSEGTPDMLQTRLQVWNLTLKDYDYSDVERAVKEYIQTTPGNYMPVPGAVIELIHKPKINGLPTPDEAWSMVRKAISDGYYHHNERFNELPEVVKRAVVTPMNLKAWAELDSEVVSSVIASNFRRSYADVMERVKLETVNPTTYRPKIVGNVELPKLSEYAEGKGEPMPEELAQMLKEKLLFS